MDIVFDIRLVEKCYVNRTALINDAELYKLKSPAYAHKAGILRSEGVYANSFPVAGQRNRLKAAAILIFPRKIRNKVTDVKDAELIEKQRLFFAYALAVSYIGIKIIHFLSLNLHNASLSAGSAYAMPTRGSCIMSTFVPSSSMRSSLHSRISRPLKLRSTESSFVSFPGPSKPSQQRMSTACPAGYDIHEVVHAVAEIDIYRAAVAPKYLGALCFALMRMACRVLNSAVGLGLAYSQPLFAAVGKAAHNELSDQSPSKRQCVLAEKFSIRHHSTILSV